MSAWVVGHNFNGSPDVVTHAYADHAEAAASLDCLLLEYADEDDAAHEEMLHAHYAHSDDVPDDEWPSMTAHVRSVLRDFSVTPGQPWVVQLSDNDDRRVNFWLEWSDDRDPDN